MRRWGAWTLLGAVLCVGCARPSLLGESCARTDDCDAPLRCRALKCVKPKQSETGHRTFSTLEDFGRELLAVVKRRDREAFANLLPTREEFGVMVRHAKPHMTDPEIDHEFQRFDRELPRRFARLQHDLDRSGVDVASLQYVGLRPYQVHDRRGVGLLDQDLAVVVRASNGSEWFLDVETVIRWQGVWILVDPEVEFEPLNRSGGVSSEKDVREDPQPRSQSTPR